MATIPTVSNFDLTKIPVEGTAEFRANASYVWSTIPGVITSMNNSITAMNSTASEMNSLRNATANDSNLAQEASLNAQASANFKGAWSSKGYALGESVLGSDNVFYVCLQTHTTAQNPTTTSGYWKPNVPMGAIGNINSPLLDLPLQNSLAMKAGVGSMTFTRSTTATYIDRYGVLKTAGVDEPRFEKDGLLIEGSSTNLHLHGECDSGWLAARADLTYNYTQSPDLGNKAMRVVCNTAGTVYTYITNTVTAGNTYTQSYFVKNVNTDGKFMISLHSSTFGDGKHSNFDLNTKTIFFKGTQSASITELADGWFRLSVSDTATVSDTNYVGILYQYTSANVGDEFLVYGAQLEELPLASSYIPTTTSAVTRGSDVCNVTRNGNLPNVEKDGEATIYCEASFLDLYSNFQYIWGLYSNANDKMGLFYYVSTIRTRCGNSNSIRDLVSTGFTPSSGVTNSYTWVANNNFHRLYIDGILNTENTTPANGITETQNSTYDYIRIGGYHQTSVSIFYGHIKNLKIYDKTLTATEVALLG